ncbi:hypothetical protein AA0116_g12324 [Alternaria tenuissima]|nr:hypothetical protein AA0116_g12324 [Alternaria tenuissima]
MPKTRGSRAMDYHRELETLAKFSESKYEKSFVKFFGWYECTDAVYIAMEYLPLGDLYHYLARKKPLPQSEVQELTRQILDALCQMHDNGYVHRDLKPGPPQEWCVKLADFGISKRFEESNEPSTVLGTEQYMAPELFFKRGKNYPASYNHRSADLWAVGEIAFQMLTGEPVFTDYVTLYKYYDQSQEFPGGRLMQYCGKIGIDLISRLMIADPKHRISTSDAFRHSWLSVDVSGTSNNIDATRTGSSGLGASGNKIMDNTDDGTKLFSDTLTGPKPRVDSLAQSGLADDFRPLISSSTTMPGSFPSDSSSPSEFEDHLKDSESEPTVRPATVKSSTWVPASVTGESEERGSPSPQHASTLSIDEMSISDKPTSRSYLSLLSTYVWAQVLSPNQTFTGHSETSSSILFSPDAQRLLALSHIRRGCMTTMVMLWHTQSGSVFRQFCPIEDDTISASAFAPNGRLIAFSYGHKVITWDTDTDEIRTIISGQREQIEALAISPNGKELATGSGDGAIAIWNFHTGKRLFSLRDTTTGWWDDVREIRFRRQCLTYSRDGDNLSFASSEKSACMYEMRGCRGVGLEANLEWIGEVCISPDGRKAAFLGFNGYLEDKRIVLLIDLEKKIELCTLEVKVRNRSTPRVGFSHDGTKIALPSSNRTVAIHDAESGALLLRFTVEKAHAIAVAWLPDNRSIVLALADGTVGIWDTQM